MHFKAVKSSAAVQICVWKTNRRWQERGRTSGKYLAGVYVPADIYVRYLRLKKEDVLFIGGSDEHGVPITIRAKKEGITP